MRLIILTQYFPPETGAPQNRLFDMARHLKERNVDVVVLTAMPNYPAMRISEGYRGKLFYKEKIDGIQVYRSWIYVSKSKGILSRLVNYFSFVLTSLVYGLFVLPKADFLLCESPPLFLGISAWFLAKMKSAAMIFNVSDLWPESAEKLGIINNKSLLRMATRLEMFLYRHSVLITGQTQGICNNIAQRLPGKNVWWFKNGFDPVLFNPDFPETAWRRVQGFTENQFILLYAGILGHAQGLGVILDAAAELKSFPDIQFIFIGEGPLKQELSAKSERLGLTNVKFFPAMPKSDLLEILSTIDAGIVPLKAIELFKGAIPSKLFDFLAMKKPILLGVDGEARELFINKGNCGLYFEPENDKALAEGILKLYNDRELCSSLGINGYLYVSSHFDRRQIAQDFLQGLADIKKA